MDPTNGGALLNGDGPLAGAVVCSTSVPDEKRTELAAQAEQMGAIHRFDLTLDVTHLIVGKYDTDKYRYVAKGRPDVRPMTPEWIGAVRELWISDQEIDTDQLERDYTLPTLHSLKLSMTGCDDPNERQRIAEQIRANGAAYEGDLTKQITHLISFRTEGQKYTAARSWGIKVVSIEWLRDSLERGMILKEELYDPLLPVHKRGVDAWDRTKPEKVLLGKRIRNSSDANADGNKRKLRRTASTKLNSQNGQIWGDIVGGGMVTQVNRSGQWDSAEVVKTENSVSGLENTEPRTTFPKPHSTESAQVRKGMFSGHQFYTYGFSRDRAQILSDHLTSHGAQVSSSVEDITMPKSDPTRIFMVVPHDLPVSAFPLLPSTQLPVESITLWWVERCLHNKRFMDPHEHIIGRPFSKFPIDGFAQLCISTSAFTGIDLLHTTRAIKLLGGKYSEDMTPESSVLVTKDVGQLRKDKFDFAQQWKIPIVNAKWLWDSIEAGRRMPFQSYRIRSTRKSGSLPGPGEQGNSTGNTLAENSVPRGIKKDPTKPPRASGLDETAFDSHGPPVTKVDSLVKPPGLPNTAIDRTAFEVGDAATLEESHTTYSPEPMVRVKEPLTSDNSFKIEPLSERDLNSSSITVSTAPAPSNHPVPRPPQDYSNDISSLLAKAKTATAQAPQNGPAKTGRRGPKRILGRATSNVSTGSGHSRATSVESTANPSNIAEVPPEYPLNEKLGMFMNRNNESTEELPPPATQIEYDDPESREAEERAKQRMTGAKVVNKRSGMQAKAATVGDIGIEKTRLRRSGKDRVDI